MVDVVENIVLDVLDWFDVGWCFCLYLVCRHCTKPSKEIFGFTSTVFLQEISKNLSSFFDFFDLFHFF